MKFDIMNNQMLTPENFNIFQNYMKKHSLLLSGGEANSVASKCFETYIESLHYQNAKLEK